MSYGRCPSCQSQWVERVFIPADLPTLRNGESVAISEDMPGRVEVGCAEGHRFTAAKTYWALDEGLSFNGLVPIVEAPPVVENPPA